MNCNKCKKHKSQCGCKDKPFTTIFPCPPAQSCHEANPCPNIQDAHCVIYNGPILTNFGINPGDRLDEVIQKIALWTLDPNCVNPDNSCASVLNVQSFSITNTTFGISWTPQVSSVSYQVQYKLSTSNVWTLNPTLSNTQFQDTISGLLPNTTYNVRVLSTCASGSCMSLVITLKTKS